MVGSGCTSRAKPQVVGFCAPAPDVLTPSEVSCSTLRPGDDIAAFGSLGLVVGTARSANRETAAHGAVREYYLRGMRAKVCGFLQPADSRLRAPHVGRSDPAAGPVGTPSGAVRGFEGEVLVVLETFSLTSLQHATRVVSVPDFKVLYQFEDSFCSSAASGSHVVVGMADGGARLVDFSDSSTPVETRLGGRFRGTRGTGPIQSEATVVASLEGEIQLISKIDGRSIWATPVAQPPHFIAEYSEYIAVVAATRILGVDRATGEIMWQRQTESGARVVAAAPVGEFLGIESVQGVRRTFHLIEPTTGLDDQRDQALPPGFRLLTDFSAHSPQYVVCPSPNPAEPEPNRATPGPAD